MDERFIPLAVLLRTPGGAEGLPHAAVAPASPAPPATPSDGVVPGIIDFAHADLVHDFALVRLAALEAFEGAARRLLRALAQDVLGRELVLAPVDLDALAREALGTLAASDAVALAVSAADAARVHSPLPVRVDPGLGAGDLVVEVRDGAFESRFVFRLESALDRAGGGA